MIASFDRPNSQQIKDFWLRVCHSAGQDGSGDGLETVSGWITAFCFWSEKGRLIAHLPDEQLEDGDTQISVAARRRLILDDVAYPIIRPNSIPPGVVSVTVAVQDTTTGLEHATTMIAGSVGMTATAACGGRNLAATVVQPRSGWWVLQDSVKPIGR